MIYRGPGFLSIVRFGSSPHPSALSASSASDNIQEVLERDNLVMGDGGGDGEEPNRTTARKPGPL
jgi:hypothetical protein